MIIKKDDNLLIEGICPDLIWYIEHTGWEEIVFRVWGVMLLQFFFGWWIAIIVTTIIWSLLHLVGFKWQMVVATMILGVGLGWCMAISWLPCGLGSLPAFLLHLFFGYMGYKLGIIEKWIR